MTACQNTPAACPVDIVQLAAVPGSRRPQPSAGPQQSTTVATTELLSTQHCLKPARRPYNLRACCCCALHASFVRSSTGPHPFNAQSCFEWLQLSCTYHNGP